MKRFLLLLGVLLAAGMAAQAQVVLGLKAGVSSSHVDLQEGKDNLTQFRDKNNIAGYHVGLYTRFKALGFLLQPEAVLASSGGRVVMSHTQNGTTVETKEKFVFNRLDVPVLTGIQFFNVVRLQAGPVASVLLKGKLSDQDVKEYFNRADFGWQAGVGVDVGRVSADIRYERIKRNYTNPNQNQQYDVGNQQLMLSLGLKLAGS